MATGATPSGGIVLTEEFRHALDMLDRGCHVFLTGKAGTGKSTLIRRFIAETERNVVVAAPTGIAALNVDGYTIHRLFGFQSTTTLQDVRVGTYRPGRFTKMLSALDTLIIDEASMVRADVFDMLAASLERFGPQPGEPFGGVQIVLVGDLYQLPPVVREGEAEYFTTEYATPYFFSAQCFRREDFPTVALTTVFRQLGDDRMTAILNEIREGVLLDHAREQLNARTDPDFEPPDGEFWLTVAPTNRLVTARNRQHLERLPGDEVVSHARVWGDLSLFDPPADDPLRFKVGAQIMMLNNDQTGRWVNGTLGRIVDVEGESSRDLVVTVEFTDGTTADVTPFSWEATRPVVDGGALRREVVGMYTQLPFKLAWAITIHKSQGQTLDRLVVDLTGGMFSTGQLYVALSRCTSMSGLVLKRPVLPKDLKTDRRIARFLRTSVGGGAARRYCAVSILTVGDEGRLSRPRPVELAVAFDDGTAVTTVVNPQRDLAQARRDYGIAVGDVLLAPTLAEAWAVLAPMLAGCTPVGVAVDETMGLIDFELKRLGFVTPMPLGVELRGRAPRTGSALERARAMLELLGGAAVSDAGEPFEEPDAPMVSGLLVTRDGDVPTPSAEHLPALSALLRVSRDISAILLNGVRAPTSESSTWDAAARQSVADQLRTAASRVSITADVMERLRAAQEFLGVEVVSAAASLEQHDISTALVPGARICFTGTAQDPSGRIVEREEMERLAAAAGLRPVKTVTKTRCEVLVTAEAGSQSGKARKAVEYGKPVFSADQFFAWVDSRESLRVPRSHSGNHVGADAHHRAGDVGDGPAVR